MPVTVCGKLSACINYTQLVIKNKTIIIANRNNIENCKISDKTKMTINDNLLVTT